MDIQQIARHISQCEFVQALVDDAAGPFEIGVGLNPNVPNQPAVILDIVSAEGRTFPDTVAVGGYDVPLVVREGYAPARLL